MPLEAYREALAKFQAVKSELIATADACSRISDSLREHPIRLNRTCDDVQAVSHLGELLLRFEAARDGARSSFLEVPSRAREDLAPPP